MNPGDLRHRVTIQRLDPTTRDEYKAVIPSWGPVVTVWAAVESVSGREAFIAQQVMQQSTHRITIRYRSDVTATMRVAHGDRLYDIKAALDRDGRRRWLQLLCEEVSP